MLINHQRPTKKQSIAKNRAFILVAFYFIVSLFLGEALRLVLSKNEVFHEHHTATEIIVNNLQIKNSVTILNKHDLKEIDTNKLQFDSYELKEFDDYLLISSKDAFIGIDEEDINIDFIMQVFNSPNYLYNNYNVYRLLPKDISEDILTTYNISFDNIEHKIEDTTGFTIFAGIIGNFIIYVVLLVGIIIISFNSLKLDYEKTLQSKKIISTALIGIAMILFFNLIGNLIVTILSGLFNERTLTSVNQATIVSMFGSKYSYLIILNIVLFGPIVEELIFRKGMFGLFKNKKAALIISSLLFASTHLVMEDSLKAAIINFIPYFTPGLIFGYLYLDNNENIIIPTLTHILWNLISTVVILSL